MERSKNKTDFVEGRYFICLSCLVLLSLLPNELLQPVAEARRSHAAHKKRSIAKPVKKEAEAAPDTTKQFFQDIGNLGKAYALYDLGLNEYMVGDYGLAHEHLSSALQFFSATYGNNLPQQETFFYDLALAQEGAGKFDQAIESYNKCLNHQGFFDGHLALAQLYGRMGKWQEGADACRRALDLKPDDPRANLIYGLIFEKQGQLSESAKYKTKAKDFVSTYGLAGVKDTTDKEPAHGQTVNPDKDNLPGEGPQDLELP